MPKVNARGQMCRDDGTPIPGWDKLPEWKKRLETKPDGCISTFYRWRDPATIKPRLWLYGHDILRGHARTIVAPGAAGKTILSVGEALCMVTGRPLLGKPVHFPNLRVWLWNLEDPSEEIARIIQAACKHWGLTEADLGGRLLLDSALDRGGLPLNFAGPGEGGFRVDEELACALTDELSGAEIDYLHVDPFVGSHHADESDNGQIDQIAKRWAMIAHQSQSAIGLAHHTSKAGAGEVTALSARGAVSLINACRSALTINRMTSEEAERYGIEGERRRFYFCTYDDKPNRAPPADDRTWYRMTSVCLDNAIPADDQGPAVDADNVGVAVPWSPPQPFDGVTSDHLAKVQARIADGDWRAHHSAENWGGRAVADAMALDADSKADRVRIIALLKTWTSNGALRIEYRKDEKTRQTKPFLAVGDPVLP